MTARSAKAVDAVVGARIAVRRRALGLSQTALAGLVGVSCQQIQKYENGQNRISVSRLHTLSLALGLPVEAFFPDRPDGEDAAELTTLRALTTTPEGQALADGFARIHDPAVRRALTRLVEVLAAA